MSWADRIALGGVLWGLAGAVGFTCAGDWRRGLYFLLGAAITVVAVWVIK